MYCLISFSLLSTARLSEQTQDTLSAGTGRRSSMVFTKLANPEHSPSMRFSDVMIGSSATKNVHCTPAPSFLRNTSSPPTSPAKTMPRTMVCQTNLCLIIDRALHIPFPLQLLVRGVPAYINIDELRQEFEAFGTIFVLLKHMKYTDGFFVVSTFIAIF